MYWVVRSSDVAAGIESAIQSAVHSVDPEVATSSMRTLDAIVQSSLSPRRLNVRLLELFAQVAIVLAAMGVYAVAAFSVGMRRREFAIRTAFGARRRSLSGLVLSEELRPVILGLVLGLAVALGLGRFLEGLVFEISLADPVAYASASVALLAVSVIAVLVPVRRAGSIDPATLLRQ